MSNTTTITLKDGATAVTTTEDFYSLLARAYTGGNREEAKRKFIAACYMPKEDQCPT